MAVHRSREVRALMVAMRPLSRPLNHLLFGIVGAYLGVGVDLLSPGRCCLMFVVYVVCMVIGKPFIAAIGARILKVRESSKEPSAAALLPQGVLAFELLRMSRERFVGIESFQSSWDLVCATVTIGLLLGTLILPGVTRRVARSPGDLPETSSEEAP